MFHRPSFSPVSFSRVSFNGASQPVEQEGRSGYWRLFFTQLQEDSEKKPVLQDTFKTLEVSPKPSPITSKTKAKKVASKPLEKEETPPPFRPLPAFDRKQEYNYLVHTWNVTCELRLMVAQFNQTKVKFTEFTDAANDEDDIELLLLVA